VIGNLGAVQVGRAGVEQLSQALRRLRRDWAFTAAFVATLALGIATNLAVFAALDAYFLRPLPYPHDQRLVAIYFGAEKISLSIASAMSPAGYQRLRSARALSASGLAHNLGNLTVAIPGEPVASQEVAALTASTLETLAVKPLLGRWISPLADRPGGPTEVDVSYGFWQSAFHGNSAALGRTLRISGQPFTVVGVMPAGFAFPARHTALWAPIPLTPESLSLERLSSLGYMMIARLRPSATRVELHTELDGLETRLLRATPTWQRKFVLQFGPYVAFMPLRQFLGGTARGRLLMMQLGAVFLLVLATASLVNLALARALRRRDDAALRVVLGAGRPLLLAQALLEALPLAAVATLIAWPLTDLGTDALARFGIASASTSFALDTGGALWVLAFGAALLLSSAALALPLAFVRVNRPAELLYGTGKGGGSHRIRLLRFALSVGQIGLAIALLAAGLLLGRSLRNMLNTDHGFNSRKLYAAMLSLQGHEYDEWGAWFQAHQRLAAAVAAIPGVQVSGIGEGVPFSGSRGDLNFLAMWPARASNGSTVPHSAAITLAGPGLMRTLGVRLLAGRLLDASDVATNAPSIVIDERFADALFGSPNVLGRSLNCNVGICRIVGVAGAIQDRFASAYASVSGTAFLPEEPRTFRLGETTSILIRSSVPPDVLARELRHVVRLTLPDQSLIAFAPMRELISDSAQGAAALASLLIAFGLLAFTLAIIGTYGVVAYVTGLRRREFAVRQVVGAEPAQIESLVLGQGVMLWVLGTLAGVGCALVFARSLAADLYEVSLLSPATYLLPAVVVGVAVMLASWIPARGARKRALIAEIQSE
jgi:putative ABC transport system permease protein